MTACGYAWHPTPEPCMLVTLQGLELYSSGPVYGTHYGLTSPIDGWANGGVGTGGPVSWENADGGIMTDVAYGGRSLVIEGDIYAADHAEYSEAVEALGAVLAYPRTGFLEVDETYHLGLTRRIEVARLRPPQISQIGPTYGIFTLALESAAFVREGVDEQSAVITSAGIDLTNHGNYPADVLVKFQGTLSSPGLSWPGGAWTLGKSVSSGTTVEVDMTRRAVRDPATGIHYRQYATGQWLRLPPGTTRVKRTGTGTGTITAAWRSTWA